MADLAVWICGIAVVLTVLNMIAGWFNNDQDNNNQDNNQENKTE